MPYTYAKVVVESDAAGSWIKQTATSILSPYQSCYRIKNGSEPWSSWREEMQLIEHLEEEDANLGRWYRLYSDGFLEQGGFVALTLSASNTDYNWVGSFLKHTTNGICVNSQASIESGWSSYTFGGLEYTHDTYVGGYVRSTGGIFPREIKVYWRVCCYTPI